MVQTHCPKCNTVFMHTADHCPKCDAPLPVEKDVCEDVPTYQASFNARTGAYLFDLVFFVLVIWAVLNLVYGPSGAWPFVAAVLIYPYFLVFDFFLGKSPGKTFAGLEVKRTDGEKLEIRDAAIESLGKIPFILPFDLYQGMRMARCESMRYTSDMAGTMVLKVEEKNEVEELSPSPDPNSNEPEERVSDTESDKSSAAQDSDSQKEVEETDAIEADPDSI